jgi:putative colanic acid biosynthesis acetyltransferase WcaB
MTFRNELIIEIFFMNLHNKIKNFNTKGTVFLCFFRVSGLFTKNLFLRIIGLPIRLIYKLFIQWILGIDIPDSTKIGANFNLFHGIGVVINASTIVGDNVTIRQCTTIGNARPSGGSPIIGDNVEIGSNVVIIGEIRVGKNSTIGAGSVLTTDIPDNSVVVGNPARVIKIKT